MASHLIRLLVVPLLACSCLVAGCATGPNPRDPYESLNRKVYSFNEGVDKAVLKPVARGYVAVVPRLARRGVTNFFNNLGMVVTTFNDALQAKGTKVPVDFARFTTNVVFGLGGLIDVASELRIENRNEDFGQTLGYWGLRSGPYLVLPFFGPSTVRDGSGLAVDFLVSPFVYVEQDEIAVSWSLFALDVVDTRANLLGAESFLEEAALDRYSFLRDSYLQRRDYLIHDGNPPQTGESRQKTLRELEEEDLRDEPVPLRTAPRIRRQ
jgi:phospholipid-binding lipoprotein MlaA